MKKISNWLFRKDLELNKKWWHRLLKVLFGLSVLGILVLSYLDFNITGYSPIGNVSEYYKNTKIPIKIQDLINEQSKTGIIIGNKEFEPTNGKDEVFAISRDSYCSLNMSEQLKYLNLNGYEFWKGEMFNRTQVNIAEYEKYLKDNNINCINLTFYTEQKVDKKMVQSEKSDYYYDSVLYEPNNLKTLFYFIFGTYGSTASYQYYGVFTLLFTYITLTVFLYYKLILYIIFGSKK